MPKAQPIEKVAKDSSENHGQWNREQQIARSSWTSKSPKQNPNRCQDRSADKDRPQARAHTEQSARIERGLNTDEWFPEPPDVFSTRRRHPSPFKDIVLGQ